MAQDAGNEQDAQTLRQKLNQETSQIPWREMQTYFARGQVVRVADTLNLLDVAEAIAQDQSEQVKDWMTRGDVGEVSDQMAQAWFEADTDVWALVILPWVLVQAVTAAE